MFRNFSCVELAVRMPSGLTSVQCVCSWKPTVSRRVTFCVHVSRNSQENIQNCLFFTFTIVIWEIEQMRPQPVVFVTKPQRVFFSSFSVFLGSFFVHAPPHIKISTPTTASDWCGRSGWARRWDSLSCVFWLPWHRLWQFSRKVLSWRQKQTDRKKKHKRKC